MEMLSDLILDMIEANRRLWETELDFSGCGSCYTHEHIKETIAELTQELETAKRHVDDFVNNLLK